MARRLTWARAGGRYPDLTGIETEVGVVKLVPAPAGAEWTWSMLLTHPGPAFRQPTNGHCQTRGQAAAELRECYVAFRDWFGIEN